MRCLFAGGRLPGRQRRRRICFDLGPIVVSSAYDWPAEFWEIPELNKQTLVSDKLHTSGVAFFRDGRVATCSDKTAQIWDPPAQRSIRTMYSDQTALRSIALSPDERLLAAGDELGPVKKVKVWDVATGQEVAVCDGSRSPNATPTDERSSFATFPENFPSNRWRRSFERHPILE